MLWYIKAYITHIWPFLSEGLSWYNGLHVPWRINNWPVNMHPWMASSQGILGSLSVKRSSLGWWGKEGQWSGLCLLRENRSVELSSLFFFVYFKKTPSQRSKLFVRDLLDVFVIEWNLSIVDCVKNISAWRRMDPLDAMDVSLQSLNG